MERSRLVQQIFDKGTYLCVGLDTDRELLPAQLKERVDGVTEFNRQIIAATMDHCVAYKINTAFYEADGLAGWQALEDTLRLIPDTHLSIADAKRGDIGNTSARYARAFFDTLPFDALTVAPYMGEDSIQPFLDRRDKWTILLGLTSNPGARDFELLTVKGTEGAAPLFEEVMRRAMRWGGPDQLMFVTGATQAPAFRSLRALAPQYFFLVPGVGAQGGDLRAISEAALTADCGLLVNASRAVIYASTGADFAEAAGRQAAAYAAEMKAYLEEFTR